MCIWIFYILSWVSESFYFNHFPVYPIRPQIHCIVYRFKTMNCTWSPTADQQREHTGLEVNQTLYWAEEWVTCTCTLFSPCQCLTVPYMFMYMLVFAFQARNSRLYWKFNVSYFSVNNSISYVLLFRHTSQHMHACLKTYFSTYMYTCHVHVGQCVWRTVNHVHISTPIRIRVYGTRVTVQPQFHISIEICTSVYENI